MRHTQEDAGFEAPSKRVALLEELSSIENGLAEVERAVEATCALKKLEEEAKKARRQQELHSSAATTSQESLRVQQTRIEEVRVGKRQSGTRCCSGNLHL